MGRYKEGGGGLSSKPLSIGGHAVMNDPYRAHRTRLMELRRAITAAYRRDEADCLAPLLALARMPARSLAAARERARALALAVREKRSGAGGVDNLMREFSLSSQEGVALMCLAEALLRIPDADTADRLIRDKIAKGDWRAHLGHSRSLFVNAAAWGLLVTGKLVATVSEGGLSSALTRLIARGGEPLIRKGVDLAMRMLGQQFVTGQTIAEALERAREPEARGYRYSYDMLGEAALTAADAARYLAAYEQAIHAIGAAAAGRGICDGPGISVKLSALHPRYSRTQRERVMDELLPRLKGLLLLARRYDIGLNIDAEEADRLELSLDLLEALAFDPDLTDWHGIGFVVQAYQKRCPFVIDYLVELAHASGHRLMVRLVKGAYWDSEIKRAQVDGQKGYPVYTRKPHTDVAYLACARKLLEAGEAVYAQFATHNAYTVAAVQQMALDLGATRYEFQCLHGMGESLYDEVVRADRLAKPCRIYAPVGSHETLLPYLVRRLLENGANSSFVNRIVDETVSMDELIADPVEQVARDGGHAHPRIPLPGDLYGPARCNSAGVDLSNEAVLTELTDQLNRLADRHWSAAPILAQGEAKDSVAEPVVNPADHHDRVGEIMSAAPEDVARAVSIAERYAPSWGSVPASDRAAMLERAADLFERERVALISLCVREAGKTWVNAVGEVREATDFCRYYAQQLRERFAAYKSAPLGPVVCISPWNFPLAIFVGQVSAALAAGNPVLAKPAEQTSLIAAFAVNLLHEAGIPPAALQLLPGRGEVIGAALTSDARVRGVVFTGSTEVAQAINRTLANRSTGAEDIPLIAETGGQNAMIVDSSALAEQVVQDALVSAFDSAGQRCSALRVLCLQAEVADRVLDMLQGAMEELSIGDPRHLSTDIGPVIDADAQRMLEAHVESLRRAGRRVFRLPLPPHCAAGTFVAPTLIEIDSIAELQREVFGPVLHVLRFERAHLERLIDDINASGYGLTLGVHSRIDETIDLVAARAHVGNIYVNRNMIGAVVGVQPFGGEGKSGTGPKAGGLLYLQRLMRGVRIAPASVGAERDAARRVNPARLDALAKWAQDAGRQELFELCAAYRDAMLLDCRVALPGPTGERNTQFFAPRGNAVCIADTETQLLVQIAAVLATGNQAVVQDAPLAQSLLRQLPRPVTQDLRVTQDWRSEPFAMVLFAGAADALRQEIAARDGALVPFVAADEAGRYPLHRLIVERVVSINTAAAGGNASLMTLAP